MSQDGLLGEPPWGYAAGRSASGDDLGWSPPTPLLVHVRASQYAALEQPMTAWLDRGLPTQFPLRVAETIADPALVPHLLERTRGQEREVRRLAIFTLGWVARHHGAAGAGAATPSGGENGWPQGRPEPAAALQVARDVAAALVEVAAAEPERFLAMTALDPLSHLPDSVQLAGSALPAMMRHRDWEVRHPALQAAHLCPVQDVEPALLDAAAGPDAIARAHAAVQLRRCTGPQVDEVLVGLLAVSDGEVRGSALSSLVARDAARALPHVRAAAASWPSPVRQTATALLVEHGDEQDVALVAERVRRLLGRQRALETIPSELTHLLPFLVRHRPAPAADAALAYVTKRWTTLFDAEQRWVADALPALVPDGVPRPPPLRPRITRTPRCPTDLDALLRPPAPASRRPRWRRSSD